MFKNLNIGKKLIVSFVLIAILASISGIVSVSIMKVIDTRYSNALVEYGFAQGDIGKLMAAFCRVDGNVHDAISYYNADDRAAAQANVPKQAADIPGYFAEIEADIKTDEGRDLFNVARTAWDGYLAKATELVGDADVTNEQAIQQLQARLVDELDPYYMDVYNSLKSMMDIKVSSGDTESTQLTNFSTISILISVILIVVAMFLSVLLGVVVSNGISKPIKACANRLQKLSEGDLESTVPVVKSRDETGTLATATGSLVSTFQNIIGDVDMLLTEMSNGNFAVMTRAEDAYIGDFLPLLTALRKINNRLSDTLRQINEAADQVSSGSDQVSSGAQALSQGATEQASSVEELAATINEISNHVQQNALHAHEASQKSQETAHELENGKQQMTDMVSKMDEINGAAAQISKIIKTIEDIAFQTNILALNAAVEAARAGAAGKGFAVVADEVRSLANKSQEASKDTATLIERALQAVEAGTQKARETSSSVERIIVSSEEAAQLVHEISKASREQDESIQQITQGVEQISAVVQTNSATAEESAAASEELTGQAAMLKDLVSQFKLKQGNAASFGLNTPAPRAEASVSTYDRYNSFGSAGTDKY